MNFFDSEVMAGEGFDTERARQATKIISVFLDLQHGADSQGRSDGTGCLGKRTQKRRIEAGDKSVFLASSPVTARLAPKRSTFENFNKQFMDDLKDNKLSA